MKTTYLNEACMQTVGKVFIPMYETLEVNKCEKCGKTSVEPKELTSMHAEERKV